MSHETRPGYIVPVPKPETPVTGGNATVLTPQGDRLPGIRNGDGSVYVPTTKETYSDKK